jgi:hypothetical protein
MRSCTATKRRRCDSPTLRRPAHATCSWRRFVVTSRLMAGWKCLVPRYIRWTLRSVSPIPSREALALARRAFWTAARRPRLLPEARSDRGSISRAWALMRWHGGTRAVLTLDVEENVGVRQQRLLEADESGAALARGEEAYVRWKETRSTAVAEASRPSIQVQTVTTFAAGASLAELDFAFFGAVRFAASLRAGSALALPRFELFLRVATRFFALALPCEICCRQADLESSQLC